MYLNKDNKHINLNVFILETKTKFLKKITNRLELKIIKNLNLNLRNKSKVKLYDMHEKIFDNGDTYNK